jgi:dipeptidyl aminopeptidase/acylaminoacyl peptidase
MSPRWSPDGARLAFVRAGEGEGSAGRPQIWLLPMAAGEARPLTRLSRGAGSPAWSPDGRTIAFTSATTAADLAKARPSGAAAASGEGEGEGEGAAPERESDVRVITRAVYRDNDSGYLDPRHPDHLWVVEAPAAADGRPEGAPAAPRQVTSGSFEEGEPVWSRDGQSIYFLSNRVHEPYYKEGGQALYAVPAAGGEIVAIAAIDGDVESYAMSPDGQSIAFVGTLAGHPSRSYDQADLFVTASVPGSKPRNLTASLDLEIGGSVAGDQHAPRAGSPARPVWTDGGRALLVRVAAAGRADLERFEVGSPAPPRPVVTGPFEVVSYAGSPDGARLAFVLSTPTEVGDLFAADSTVATASARQAAPHQLTRFNEPLFSQIHLTPPEEIRYRSFDGREIQAWVQKPPDFSPGRKYPLILNIHGGPHTAYGYTFDHEFQWMAARGYVVLYPNPRGSSAYGREFGNIIQYHYPGDDYRDLMAGVDEVIRRGWVDPARLGITGGSGGGVLTNWAITQTGRFAAAVSQRSIADWAAWWYTDDFTLFTPRWFKGAPWQDPADYAARSPITHIDKVTTPLMLIEGEADFRTPPTSGGEQMFRALKYLKKPVVMVRFPGETHELSRSGRPWHRIERLQHIVRWFDVYLQGRATDLYDVP